MRVVVCPNSMEIGGSQLNAIEIAELMHRRGHHVAVFAAANGPLVERVRAAGMTFEPAPERPRVRPSPAVMRELVRVTARHRAQIVHGYEWPPVLEAYYGPFLRLGVAPVGTVMSMGVAPFIPPSVPLVVGTEQIAEHERLRRPIVDVIEPPVDFELNRPGLPLPEVRTRAAAGPEDLLVVVVGRLANELKREGLLDAVKAVGALSSHRRVRLAVVGDGPAREELESLAAQVNAAGPVPVVTMVGEVDDPRPWYSDADVVLGMGSSALRAMAFGKPLVVQGERGFWKLLTPESSGQFLHQGWYGVGDGVDGAAELLPILEELSGSPRRREELGAFALELVHARFGLEQATDQQERIYEQALPPDAGTNAGDPEDEPARGSDNGLRSAASRRAPAGSTGRGRLQRHRRPAQTQPGELMSSTVPLIDVAATQAAVIDEIRPVIDDILSTGAFIGGPQVAAFESAYAAYAGARHCVGVANGTDALEIALRAVGVTQGSEVVLPANTFVATAEAVARAGARVVLVDADDDHLLMCTKLVQEVVTERTAAIVPVHLYGQLAPVEELTSITLPDGAAIVEDGAQSQGATRFGTPAGVHGAAVATSFYPGKNLGAAGDAGAVTTDDDALARLCRLLGAHGSETKYVHEVFGFNSRLDALQAVVLRAKLAHLDGWNQARRAAADRYEVLLSEIPAVRRPRVLPGNEHVWHLYTVRVPERDRVLSLLNQDGIGAGIHYPTPVHLAPAFADLGYGRGDFPVSEAAADSLLSLPIDGFITPDQQERVAEALQSALARI